MSLQKTLHPVFRSSLEFCGRHKFALAAAIGALAIPSILGAIYLKMVMRVSKTYSRTAEIACALRHLSTKESEPRYRTRDHLAHFFLPIHHRWLINWFSWFVRRKAERSMPGALGWVVARTHIYDHTFEKVLREERDVTQVVILGAGFDTRFSRCYIPNDRMVRLFEVDAPATQQHKRDIMNGIPNINFNDPEIQSKIVYVPANFEIDTITQVMERTTSYDPKAKTLFIWEAVTPYLTEDAVDSVLEFIRTKSGSKSILAFDLRFKEAVHQSKKYNAGAIVNMVSKVGESYKFGVPENDIEKWVSSKGFQLDSLYLPPRITADYLTSDDAYSIPCLDIVSLLVVRTP